MLNHAIQVAAQVAPTDMTVLITGESGSGKESFSKIIHNLSARKHGQFIAINCGAIPEGTIDSELFGHEKGSFTGAHDSRKGYFEVTDGGTIFLDEIGEMPLGTQARLLRVLENGEFIKVGSSKVQKTDVRVVAATNVNLLEAVSKNRFREDLYYRLNTVPIYVPPLRDRDNDIELLFRKFASDFADKYRVKPVKLTDEAREALMLYRFPGNIRQLKNIAEQISVLEMNREISGETMKKYLPESVKSFLPAHINRDLGGSDGPPGFFERDLLYKVLFDMRRDVTDLKKLVMEVLQSDSSGTELIKARPELFQDLGTYSLNSGSGMIEQDKTTYAPIVIKQQNNEAGTFHKVEDISHETADETLSIDRKEKELILLALRKNNNKRKYAAQDLGISERTLYRKIKEYDIEN